MATQWVYIPDDEGGGYYESYDDAISSDDMRDVSGGIPQFTTPSDFQGPNFDVTGYDPTSPKEVPNLAKPGDATYGWKIYENGVTIDPNGKYYKDGQLVYNPADPINQGAWGKLFSKLGDVVKTPSGIAGLLGAAYSLTGGNAPKTGGWKGTIPKLTAVRQPIEQPEYKPYSGQAVMGRQAFTTPKFVSSASEEALTSARAADTAEAQSLANKMKQPPPAQVAPVTPPAAPKPMLVPEGYKMNEFNQLVAAKATGGIAELAKGRYLAGPTDGMADKIPSSIDNKQPAKLSHGEFVIPADVVSHLGNGNSEAGANQLYKMMDRVRKARTGTKKQGKEINPEKFTPGGIAQYASGGAVALATGGVTNTGTGVSTNAPLGTTTETSLAPWVGDYVSDYLSRGLALSKEPYQAYQGPLTAGTSGLQQKAFDLAGSLGGGFDPNAINQYMNPYLSMSLAPQLAEQRRQADITQQGIQGQFTRAGAFGGAREALARTENLRNLADLQSRTVGQAYQTAYDKALGQYNTAQQQKLADISALFGLGKSQRDIEQEAINAQKAEFEAQREDPMKKVQFAGSLLSGLPTGTTTTTPNTSALQSLGLTGDQITKLMDMLNSWGTSTTTTGAKG